MMSSNQYLNVLDPKKRKIPMAELTTYDESKLYFMQYHFDILLLGIYCIRPKWYAEIK